MFGGNANPALINLFKRQLGMTNNDNYEQIITSTQLTSYLIEKCKYNLGIGVASLCQALVNLLSEAKLPSFVDGVLDIAKTIAGALIKYAFSFGLLLAGEGYPFDKRCLHHPTPIIHPPPVIIPL